MAEIARRIAFVVLVAVASSCARSAPGGLDRVPRRSAPKADAASVVHGSTWFGYVVRAGAASSIDGVRGRWVQPEHTCASDSAAAIWVGLDGFGNGTVEQIGTEADCRAGGEVHSAWVQLYPADAVDLVMAIRPGDLMAARVVLVPGGLALRLRNLTSGASAATTVSGTPAADSAEWVVEAPSSCRRSSCVVRPLTAFGRVSFSRCAVRVGGAWRRIGGVDATPTAGGVDGVSASPTEIVRSSAFDVVSSPSA